MCAYATCTGLLTPPYPPSNCLERTIRRPNDGGGALRLQRQLHSRLGLQTSSGLPQASRSLLKTPTGHSPAVKTALTKSSLAMLPRCHTFAEFKHRLSTIPRLQGTAVPARSAPLEGAETSDSKAWEPSTSTIPENDVLVVRPHAQSPRLCTPVLDTNPCEQGARSAEPAEEAATQVYLSHISDPNLRDPMR